MSRFGYSLCTIHLARVRKTKANDYHTGQAHNRYISRGCARRKYILLNVHHETEMIHLARVRKTKVQVPNQVNRLQVIHLARVRKVKDNLMTRCTGINDDTSRAGAQDERYPKRLAIPSTTDTSRAGAQGESDKSGFGGSAAP